MYALEAETGAIRWVYRYPEQIQAYSPGIGRHLLYFSGRENDRGVVYALDGKTGEEQWRVSLKQPWDRSSLQMVAAAKDAVYVTVSSTGEGSALLALDGRTGATIWENDQEGGWFYASEAECGLLYMKDGKGTIHALDAQTGQLKWQYTPQKEGDSPDGSGFFGIVDGVIYSSQGYYSIESQQRTQYLYAVDAATGTEKWEARLPMSQGSPMSVVAGSGMVWVSTITIGGNSGSYLYGLSEDTGQERWKLQTPENLQTQPIMEGGVLYLGAVLLSEHRGNLYAIDPRTGKARWRFLVEGGIFYTPVAEAGMLYFNSSDGPVYAMRP